jgi:hypothetical protein
VASKHFYDHLSLPDSGHFLRAEDCDLAMEGCIALANFQLQKIRSMMFVSYDEFKKLSEAMERFFDWKEKVVKTYT